MKLAKVIGTVWATIKHPAYEGKKLLVLAPIDPTTGNRTDEDSKLAVDFIGAGEGDTVLLCEEGAATCELYGDDVPVVQIAIAIVDSFDAKGVQRRVV
ncbi:MAG: EutN/CcmL family microcompartment protein [Planctomycetes bacterium]|nr:EutN/CcmL family microcompartment protein [Planctomycetota bacterium]